MDVLVVGAGDVGRWFARTVSADVAFADVDETAALSAAEAVGGRAVPLGGDERFTAVVVAVPMGAVVEAIERHAPRAEEAVLDLSGVMGEPVEAMERFDLARASLHPLFAPENAPGRIAIGGVSGSRAIDTIRIDLASAGNELIETTPDEHDRAMETVQAKAHAAVLAFGLAAEEVPEGFGTPVYDELLQVLAEVTGGTPRVYADIQAAFAGADEIAEAASRIADAEGAAFERLYRQASERAGDAADADG